MQRVRPRSPRAVREEQRVARPALDPRDDPVQRSGPAAHGPGRTPLAFGPVRVHRVVGFDRVRAHRLVKARDATAVIVPVQVHDDRVRAERAGVGVHRGLVVVRQGRGARQVAVAPQGRRELRAERGERLAGTVDRARQSRPAPTRHRCECRRAHLPTHGFHGRERLAVHAVRRGDQRERVGHEEVEQVGLVAHSEDPLRGALPPRRHLPSLRNRRGSVLDLRRLHRLHDVDEGGARALAHDASEQERAGYPRNVHAGWDLLRRTRLVGAGAEERLDRVRVLRVHGGDIAVDTRPARRSICRSHCVLHVRSGGGPGQVPAPVAGVRPRERRGNSLRRLRLQSGDLSDVVVVSRQIDRLDADGGTLGRGHGRDRAGIRAGLKEEPVHPNGFVGAGAVRGELLSRGGGSLVRSLPRSLLRGFRSLDLLLRTTRVDDSICRELGFRRVQLRARLRRDASLAEERRREVQRRQPEPARLTPLVDVHRRARLAREHRADRVDATVRHREM